MTPFRVVVTDTAERHLEAIRAWWTVNRRDAPLLFVEEIEAAFERISRALPTLSIAGQPSAPRCAASCSVEHVTTSTIRAIPIAAVRSSEPYGTPLELAGRVWGDATVG